MYEYCLRFKPQVLLGAVIGMFITLMSNVVALGSLGIGIGKVSINKWV